MCSRPRVERAFTLVELLVVLAIVVILTSLLMPGLRAVRETANKLTCAANMRQIGYAITTYSTDYNERLPYSYFGSPEVHQPGEMMALTIGGSQGGFDGIGRLLPKCGHYLDTAACMYCPSHHGEHTFDRYEQALESPINQPRSYGNYHYRGDVDLDTKVRFRMANEHGFLLLSDGLRTQSDFNHGTGMNILHGDMAVNWYHDANNALFNSLPATATSGGSLPSLEGLWDDLVSSD